MVDGDRISQTVSGVTTTYILDIATPLTMVLSESTGSETVRYWHGLDTLAQSDGTTTEYFVYDGLGSVRQVFGESGSVGLAQTFDPYGNGFSTSRSRPALELAGLWGCYRGGLLRCAQDTVQFIGHPIHSRGVLRVGC